MCSHSQRGRIFTGAVSKATLGKLLRDGNSRDVYLIPLLSQSGGPEKEVEVCMVA